MTETTRLKGDIELLLLERDALKKARDAAHTECKMLRKEIVRLNTTIDNLSKIVLKSINYIRMFK